MRVLETRVPPVVVFAAAAAIPAWLAGAVPAPALDFPGRRWLMYALAGLGALSGVAGVVAFGRASTTVDPTRPQEASSLVSSGVFRLTRNPMYLGLLLLLVAWALRLGHPAGVLGPILFWAWITRFQILPEERALRQKFGAEWEAYRRRTRRWL